MEVESNEHPQDIETLIDYNLRDLGAIKSLDVKLIQTLLQRQQLKIKSRNTITLSDVYITPYLMKQVCLFTVVYTLIRGIEEYREEFSQYVLTTVEDMGGTVDDTNSILRALFGTNEKSGILVKLIIKFLQDRPDIDLREYSKFDSLTGYFKISFCVSSELIYVYIPNTNIDNIDIQGSYILNLSGILDEIGCYQTVKMRIIRSFVNIEGSGCCSLNLCSLDFEYSHVSFNLTDTQYLFCAALFYKLYLLLNLLGVNIQDMTARQFTKSTFYNETSSLAELKGKVNNNSGIGLAVSTKGDTLKTKASIIAEGHVKKLGAKDHMGFYTLSVFLKFSKILVISPLLGVTIDTSTFPIDRILKWQYLNLTSRLKYYILQSQDEVQDILLVPRNDESIIPGSNTKLAPYEYSITDIDALIWLLNNKFAIYL